MRLTLCGFVLAASVAFCAAESIEDVQSDLSFFTDSSCGKLKQTVSSNNLPSFKSETLRSLAAGLLTGSYDPAYRLASYEAYPSPAELGRDLKLGQGFSRYENITGLFLEKGQQVVLVGPCGGKTISLLIPDWMRKPPEGIDPTKDPAGWGLKRQSIKLHEGVNLVQIEKAGNAYISYYDDEAGAAPKILVHFPNAQVNGYFDLAHNTNEDWDRLLDHAVSPIMDARGKHIQVAYPVAWFKVHTRSRGADLIRNYDTLLQNHYTFMGLVKYGKVPRNRILARVNFNYYMFRDIDGVAYLGTRNVMRMVANPDVVIKGDPCWGFSHETGHVLQMIPQTTWGGLTEVSCNFFSMYTMTAMGNPSRLKAQNNYASARKNIIEAQPKASYLACKDVFDRLIPFWQLHLYFSKNGHPEFYADLMEQLRQRPDAGKGSEAIKNQFEFVKLCCDVGKTDLTDFFDQWGFFWVGELDVDDYGKFHYTITQEMVDQTKAYIAGKNYRKPTQDLTRVEE